MSGLISGSVWPFAVLVWPLLLGLVPVLPGWRDRALRVLPLAPLPALVFALLGAPGTTVVPDLILGVELGAVPGGALLLGMTAAVWTVAGWQAALSMEEGWRTRILTGFWCVTLTGNLAVFLAGDVVTFYVAFAAVSLAGWFLVVHDRTETALAAGRVYITLAILGEAALLAGFLIGAQTAESLQIPAVRAALAEAPLGAAGVALLVLGFGIKAGMVPLHVWLPLAHPVAPVPGSAVLSGAIVKAGLIGMVLFLPPGTGWNAVLLGAGFLGALGAALWGLTQSNPKAVLAYSTVSQMGLMLALLGAGQAVAFYALHHGLAKGALFLLVGVLAAADSRPRRLATLLLAGLVALSVAGLPLSGGALVKAAAKDGLAEAARLTVILSGVTTTLILAIFVRRLAGVAPAQGAPWAPLFAGAAALGLAALLVPWLLWTDTTGLARDYPLHAHALLDAAWPVALGLVLAALALRLPLPEQPPGDLLTLRPGGLGLRLPRWRAPTVRPLTGRRLLRLLIRSRGPEVALRRWPLAGGLLVAAVMALAGLLAV